MTAAAIRNPDQRTILTRFARGEDIDKIATDTNLGRDRVNDVITNVAGFDRGRARAAVLAYDAEQKATQERGVPNQTIEDLLATAEKSSIPRVERMAARIRALLQQLSFALADSEKERVLRTTIAVLRGHIAKADRELKALKAGPKRAENPKTPAVNGAVPNAVIRQWAKDNEVDCPAAGRIPKTVRARYEQAQAAS